MDGNFSQEPTFLVRALNQLLEPHDFHLQDQRVLGRQIAHVAGQMPVDTAIVLRLRAGHSLTSVPLDELIELHREQPNEFVVGSGDRTYLLFLNGERHEWAWSTVSESVLLRLAGVGRDHEVILERAEEADEVLAPGQVVDLSAAGIERFSTRLVPEVIVTYNQKPFPIRAGTYTTEQLRGIFHVEAGYALDMIPAEGDFQTLKPNEKVVIVAGLAFASVAPVGQSS